ADSRQPTADSSLERLLLSLERLLLAGKSAATDLIAVAADGVGEAFIGRAFASIDDRGGEACSPSDFKTADLNFSALSLLSKNASRQLVPRLIYIKPPFLNKNLS
ncbi:MAG: hypothetical protein AABX51_06670, partial [Nanoarchaeota archaeon]